MGLLTNLDVTLFGVFCEAVGRWRSIVEALRANAKADPEFRGLCYRDDEGNLKANPLVKASATRPATWFGWRANSASRLPPEAGSVWN